VANYLSPEEITEYTEKVGIKKSSSTFAKSFILAFMGGMFIALAAIGSLIATATIENQSIAAIIAGVVFSTGLMMVIIGGGDLFTGNVLIVVAVMRKKATVAKMTVNLCTAFLGNLAGSLFIVFLTNYSSVLTFGNGLLLKKIFLKGIHKLDYSFIEALFMGILCNILVCIAVWMAYSAKDTGGKVLGILFPIMLFILSGYEHIVANMYYIPAAILAALNPEYVKLSGMGADALKELSVLNIPHNFIPVLLGNVIGGIIIGAVYAKIYVPQKSVEE
jgi:Formate/nitrite family of transporters